LERKKATTLASTRGGVAKGGVGDVQEGDLEELDAAVDAFIWFPELRTES
jgi:hypothetical protein